MDVWKRCQALRQKEGKADGEREKYEVQCPQSGSSRGFSSVLQSLHPIKSPSYPQFGWFAFMFPNPNIHR